MNILKRNSIKEIKQREYDEYAKLRRKMIELINGIENSIEELTMIKHEVSINLIKLSYILMIIITISIFFSQKHRAIVTLIVVIPLALYSLYSIHKMKEMYSKCDNLAFLRDRLELAAAKDSKELKMTIEYVKKQIDWRDIKNEHI